MSELRAPITISYLHAMLAHLDAIHPVEGICYGRGECVTKYGMPEAEARAAVLADLRAKVEGLDDRQHTYTGYDDGTATRGLSKAAVLALLSEDAP